MARASLSDIPRYRPIGINGPMIRLFGRTPSLIARMICSSVQPPIPVSTSGVRLGGQAFMPWSAISDPPARCMDWSLPSGVFGVWQLPQAPITSTM